VAHRKCGVCSKRRRSSMKRSVVSSPRLRQTQLPTSHRRKSREVVWTGSEKRSRGYSYNGGKLGMTRSVAESNRRDTLLVPGKCADAFALVRVPEPCRRIGARWRVAQRVSTVLKSTHHTLTCDNVCRIGAPCTVPDPLGVSAEAAERPKIFGGPHLHRVAIGRCGHEHGRIRTEGCPQDVAVMGTEIVNASETASVLGRRQVHAIHGTFALRVPR
jgi:hypothetical protein